MTRSQALIEFKRIEQETEEKHRQANIDYGRSKQLLDEGRTLDALSLLQRSLKTLADHSDLDQLFILAKIASGEEMVN